MILKLLKERYHYIFFKDMNKTSYTVPDIVNVIRDNYGYIEVGGNALGQAVRRYAKNMQVEAIGGTTERKTMYSKEAVENLLMRYMYAYLLKLNGKYQERMVQEKALNERMKKSPEPYELIGEPLSEEENFTIRWKKVYNDLLNDIVIDFICNNLIELNVQLLEHDAKQAVRLDDAQENDLELQDRLNNVGIYYKKR